MPGRPKAASAFSLQIVSWLALCSVLLAAPRSPVVGKLDKEVRHAPSAIRIPVISAVLDLPGYGLSEPLVIGEWAFCVLWYGQYGGSHTPPRPWLRPTQPAVIAVNLKSGRARQLSASTNLDSTAAAEIDDLIPLDGEQCGVVIAYSRAENGKEDAVLDRSLWKWNPQTGAVVAGGDWNPARLLQLIVDPRVCEITTRKTEPGTSLSLQVRDVSKRKATNVTLDRNVRLLAARNSFTYSPVPQTIVPLASHDSFILIHRTEGIDIVKCNSVIAECIDPNAVEGRRWRLRTNEIMKRLNCKPTNVYPISGIRLHSHVLGMLVESADDGWPRTDCLIISRSSGTMVTSWRVDKPPLSGAVMSADGSAMALTREWENEKTQMLEYQVSIVDSAKGTVLSSLDLLAQYDVSVFAFEDAGHLLGLRSNDLWRFGLARHSTHKLLFRLDPSVAD
jgi:hypothetical protein